MKSHDGLDLSFFFSQTCMLCSPPMMLPNGCCVSAHQRIHKHRAPHVCPECGGIARQASFKTHLEEACLHFARRIGYRSEHCSKTGTSGQGELFMVLRTVGGKPVLFIIVLEHRLGTFLASTSG